MLTEALPPVRRKAVLGGALGPNVPRTVVWSPARAIKETGSPLTEGVGETETVAVKLEPDGEPPVGFEIEVVVAVRTAEVHFASKLPTLMEPRPVAKSYFVVA